MKRVFKLIFGLLAFFGLVTLSGRAQGSEHLLYLSLITRGPTWNEVGIGSASGGGITNNVTRWGAESPSLAIAPDGTVYVAWVGNRGEGWLSRDTEIYIRAWHGSEWVEVGAGSASGEGISQGGETSWSPSLAIAPDGTPYVAWSELLESGFKAQIYVKAWNGSSWVDVGEGSASGNGISQAVYSVEPSLAIAPDGKPYVAWQDGNSWTTPSVIYVRVWDGSHWVEVGEGSATGDGISGLGDSDSPSLAIDPDGHPYVAWRNAKNIYILAWNGAQWTEVGVGSASGGGISNDYWYSYDPSLAMSDGTAYVAWKRSDGAGNYRALYIRKWNGSIWEEVGTGSATGEGIGLALGEFGDPSLAIAPDNTPFVAWSDESSGNDEIYILAWNGSAWIEVGDGSASGGGISHSGGASTYPFLAFAPDGTPYVTWPDDSDGKWQVYVRRFAK